MPTATFIGDENYFIPASDLPCYSDATFQTMINGLMAYQGEQYLILKADQPDGVIYIRINDDSNCWTFYPQGGVGHIMGSYCRTYFIPAHNAWCGTDPDWSSHGLGPSLTAGREYLLLEKAYSSVWNYEMLRVGLGDPYVDVQSDLNNCWVFNYDGTLVNKPYLPPGLSSSLGGYYDPATGQTQWATHLFDSNLTAGFFWFDGLQFTSAGCGTLTPTYTPSKTPIPTISSTPTITYTPTLSLTPSQTFTPTLSPTRTLSPTPTFTITHIAIYFTPNINAYCRVGSDISFPNNGIAYQGQAYMMDGRNLDNTWYRIMINPNLGCWVPVDAGALSGPVSDVRVLRDVPTYTPTLSIDCPSYNDVSSCNAQPACIWIQPLTTRGYCEKK